MTSLAVGSLVYRDDETLAFTFPGQRADNQGNLADKDGDILKGEIEREIEKLGKDLGLETPPLSSLSASTRSFVPMARELRKARETLSVPVHKPWQMGNPNSEGASGQCHVCPVCLVRINDPPPSAKTDNARKSHPCRVCRERRRGRLDAWLAGEHDTIWISEVADENDRVALLTLSFDIDPWLDGSRVDSLRAQSISHWRRHNPVLEEHWKNKPEERKYLDNPVASEKPFESLLNALHDRLQKAQHQGNKLEKDDLLLPSLQDGYRPAATQGASWPDYYRAIVEDRTVEDQAQWRDADLEHNAQWLAHELFRKLPSPGRVYRFWGTAEDFFQELLTRFREITSSHANRWRVRRLMLIPDPNGSDAGWKDRETYAGHWQGAPFELVYLKDGNVFVTICNLAGCFKPEETADTLMKEMGPEPIKLKSDDGEEKDLRVKSVAAPEKIGIYTPIIPLEVTPRRFRVLVPLIRVTACIEEAIARWEEAFGRVWDRMPLRVGVVAFPRLTSFQAVIEAARNLEDLLGEEAEEIWRVTRSESRQGVTAIACEHEGRREVILVPTRLPDGREDVFYPYVQIEDRQLRFARDFQHPSGTVYRHVADLRPGDGVVARPSRIAAVFLDTTAQRFEEPEVRPLSDFARMQAVWDLLVRTSPSLSAVRGAWSEIEERARSWRDPDGRWLPGAEIEWPALTRAVLADRLGVSGAALESLVEAAEAGTLQWALEWHLTWLKEGLDGGTP